MPWTHRTEQNLHGILGTTSVAAILEMAGGADPSEYSVRIAAVCFAISVPINLYAWIMLDDDMGGGPDVVSLFSDSGLAKLLPVPAMLSTWGGISALLVHFSWFAFAAFTFVTVALFLYEYRTGHFYPIARRICARTKVTKQDSKCGVVRPEEARRNLTV